MAHIAPFINSILRGRVTVSVIGEELVGDDRVTHLRGTVGSGASREASAEFWIIDIWVDPAFIVRRIELLLQENSRDIERTVMSYSSFNEFSELPVDLPES